MVESVHSEMWRVLERLDITVYTKGGCESHWLKPCATIVYYEFLHDRGPSTAIDNNYAAFKEGVISKSTVRSSYQRFT